MDLMSFEGLFQPNHSFPSYYYYFYQLEVPKLSALHINVLPIISSKAQLTQLRAKTKGLNLSPDASVSAHRVSMK